MVKLAVCAGRQEARARRKEWRVNGCFTEKPEVAFPVCIKVTRKWRQEVRKRKARES